MLYLLAALVVSWLLWSGIYKPLLLALGAASCWLAFWLSRRMGYFDDDLFALRFSRRLLLYWVWLIREILSSSIAVSRAVLDPKLPISPCTLTVKTTSDHPFDQVMLANSITLTPGTLSMDLHEGTILVHSLTEAGARDLMTGEMDRRVTGLRDA
jgi:multicomponent Na+:H+ antiporter subunit E